MEGVFITTTSGTLATYFELGQAPWEAAPGIPGKLRCKRQWAKHHWETRAGHIRYLPRWQTRRSELTKRLTKVKKSTDPSGLVKPEWSFEEMLAFGAESTYFTGYNERAFAEMRAHLPPIKAKCLRGS
jgi:hypothetical protein